jgi:alkylation response protein AidB-like acyl-CoA dehydrogenase
MVGAFGLGAGWDALRRAILYSQGRIQAGSPLSQKQGYTHKLIVPNAARLEAARAYIEWVADRLDGGEEGLATEGAIAKYLATESGNRAAEDAIQALGGYGYTRDYMVEKIKRDVRITTIYEGTSEIMEWTIARDRWQFHLKTQGAFYQDWASRLGKTASEQPENGTEAAVLALQALAYILEKCRIERLTRNQHVLFRLGELIAQVEAAAVFAQRVVDHPTEAISLDIPTRQALARVFARRAALTVATEGLRWLVGSTGQAQPRRSDTPAELAEGVNLDRILYLQTGLLADMNCAAERLNHAFAE